MTQLKKIIFIFQQ